MEAWLTPKSPLLWNTSLPRGHWLTLCSTISILFLDSISTIVCSLDLVKMNMLTRQDNQNLVGYLVLYPGIRNPYRDLTSLVGDSPVLAHALSATGALHYALLYHEEFSPAPLSPDGSSTTTLSLQELESAVTNSVTRRPASKVYEHFLAFKQRALHQLSLDIRDPARQNDDRTVAAIIVLALVDAIESGGGAWKYHLEGAKNLLKCREYGPHAGHAQEIMHDTFAIDGCLM
jgi:hypothetical protein